jgi:membrane-bound lytic murein transglycosylase D
MPLEARHPLASSLFGYQAEKRNRQRMAQLGWRRAHSFCRRDLGFETLRWKITRLECEVVRKVKSEMLCWKRNLLLPIVILFFAVKGGYGEDETRDDSWSAERESLRKEISQIEENLEELKAQLNRIEKDHGMDRYRFPRDVQLFGKRLPLERRDVWERMDKEFLLSVHDVPQVLLWIKRANRYFPMIKRSISQSGLPEDLKYVAIVESALRPEVRSRAGALGLWQFMPTTSRRYRLEKSRWVDERLDPVQSTAAALTYLRDLYAMFGDWLLAVSAYNAGEEKIKKELKRQGVTTFYDLVLPSETERYLFRIAAAKVILSDPQAYGFNLSPEELYNPSEMEAVDAYVERGTLDLVALANACGMTLREFLTDNPHFISQSVPKGRYRFYLPTDERETALDYIKSGLGTVLNEADLPTDQSEQKIVHRVEPGETLSDIAKRYRVLVKSIEEWNGLSNPDKIHAGQRLIIYQ